MHFAVALLALLCAVANSQYIPTGCVTSTPVNVNMQSGSLLINRCEPEVSVQTLNTVDSTITWINVCFCRMITRSSLEMPPQTLKCFLVSLLLQQLLAQMAMFTTCTLLGIVYKLVPFNPSLLLTRAKVVYW